MRHEPRNAAALDSLATLSEASGGIAEVDNARLTTAEIVRRALSYSRDSVQRTRLAVSMVRLLVKEAQFELARAAQSRLGEPAWTGTRA